MTTEPHPESHNDTQASGKCPFTGQIDTSSSNQSISITRHARTNKADILPTIHIKDFQTGRDVLRSKEAIQAGFQADALEAIPGSQHLPVLYLEGEEHTEMRRATAKYFTPKHVNTYTSMIAKHADNLVATLYQKGQANLDDLSLKLAVTVAAQVIGLTNSLAPGITQRIQALASGDADGAPGASNKITGVSHWLQRAQIFSLFFLDVLPAIKARRKQPQDDLISYLIEREYIDLDILTESIMYGTAGMLTTREFISVATHHLIKNPKLRNEYLHSLEKERHDILHEILRLEPVVSTLYRRTTNDIKIDEKILPKGTVIALDVQKANIDPEILGDNAEEICPGRSLPKGIQAPVMSFGDGVHRCPGAFLAIKETDIFLRRLLMINTLKIVKEPTVTYNEAIKGYELRGFKIQVN